MSSHATLTQDTNPSQPTARQAARVEHQLDILDDLIDRGAELAKRAHEQATIPDQAGDNPKVTPEVIASFDCITRAVRRGILLSQKLAESAHSNNQFTGKPAKPITAEQRTAIRKLIIREVEDKIQRPPRARSDMDTLNVEFCERLDSPEIEDELGDRPTEEIIAEICRDLGLETKWDCHLFRRRKPRDIKVLYEHAAAAPGVYQPKRSADPPSHTPRADPQGPPRPPSLDGKNPAEAVAAILKFAKDSAKSTRDPKP